MDEKFLLDLCNKLYFLNKSLEQFKNKYVSFTYIEDCEVKPISLDDKTRKKIIKNVKEEIEKEIKNIIKELEKNGLILEKEKEDVNDEDL